MRSVYHNTVEKNQEGQKQTECGLKKRRRNMRGSRNFASETSHLLFIVYGWMRKEAPAQYSYFLSIYLLEESVRPQKSFWPDLELLHFIYYLFFLYMNHSQSFKQTFWFTRNVQTFTNSCVASEAFHILLLLLMLWAHRKLSYSKINDFMIIFLLSKEKGRDENSPTVFKLP